MVQYLPYGTVPTLWYDFDENVSPGSQQAGAFPQKKGICIQSFLKEEKNCLKQVNRYRYRTGSRYRTGTFPGTQVPG